jgi:uncharacterized repeat protein (TIGR01451 family)
VTSTVPELDPTNNTATDSTQLEVAADLVVLKSDGNTVALIGEPITYSVIVSNTGPSNDPSASVQDSVPAALQSPSWTCTATGGATCTAGPVSGDINDTASLPVGSLVTYSVKGTIRADFTGTLTNTTTVVPSSFDVDFSNNSATDTTEVAAGPMPPRPIPALDERGLAALMLMLLGIALWHHGRGRRA